MIEIPKIICRYDSTFWLHVLREFIICTAIDIFSHVHIAIGFSLGFNTAWEYQDGLRNDGANIVDFIGGLLGIGLSMLLKKY